MRGKAGAERLRRKGGGITPACAGKSYIWAGTTTPLTDHPRVCGEKIKQKFDNDVDKGSSPHVRGKVLRRRSPSRRHRITPACAGKRSVSWTQWRPQEDHPRMCGEKTRYRRSALVTVGSPPRMRGKARRVCIDTAGSRITPACAGKRSGPSPAAVPAGPAGSYPASRPSQFPPRMTVISPRP